MKYKISEIGKVVGGGTPSTKHAEYYSKNGIAWITPKDLSDYHKKYIGHGAKDISEEGLKNSSAKLLPVDSILVSSRAPIGYVAMAGTDLATSQGFKSIVPNTSKVMPEYLYYLMLKSKDKLEQIASGSTFKEISGKGMSNFTVDIPELKEQKEIVQKLNPIFKKIEENNRINDNLLDLISSIWENQSADIHNKITLKRLAKMIITGKTPSTKVKENYGTDIPFVKIPDMRNKVFIDEASQNLSIFGANSQKNKYIPENSIIVSCIGTPGLVSLIGRTVQTNQQINSLILDNKYIYCTYLELKSLKYKIRNLGSGGTTIKNLNKTDFGNIRITVPNKDGQLDRFNRIAKPIFEKIHVNNIELQNLVKVKEVLLGQYF